MLTHINNNNNNNSGMTVLVHEDNHIVSENDDALQQSSTTSTTTACCTTFVVENQVPPLSPTPPPPTTLPQPQMYHHNHHDNIDYSITNCGSNTPMMTHCPNFYSSSNKSPFHYGTTTLSPPSSIQRNYKVIHNTPPFLPLSSSQQSYQTGNVTNISSLCYGSLYLPSLFRNDPNQQQQQQQQHDISTTTTTGLIETVDETTPLWNSCSMIMNHHTVVPYDDQDAAQQRNVIADVTTSLQEKDIMTHNSASIPETNDIINTLPAQQKQNSIGISILYGMINTTIVVPIILTFTTIIYSHPIYHQYLSILTLCTLFSSMIHQIIFSTFSSLPFAIGQVQDAGLIFLSNMATQLAVHYTTAAAATSSSESDTINSPNIEHLIPTTMMALSLSTIILGIALLLIGHYRLAQYVQLLPTCVVGGYLAYIGYFCGKAGINMMLSSIPTHPTTISMTIIPKLYYILPGIIGGILIYVAIRTMKYMITLPVCIVIEMILFYIVLYATNSTIHDATIYGWIRNTDFTDITSTTDTSVVVSDKISSSSSYMWYHTWDYILQFQNIDWLIMIKLIPNIIGMIFVVTLSSSLDVTAIEIELRQQQQQEQSFSYPKTVPTQTSDTTTITLPPRKPLLSLNYNSELRMIGLSNIVSGCFGGYTGSYIFSQSIFSLRAGIRSRLAGYILALCEGLLFVLPIPILSYVPNFLFASLLLMICIDLMIEWLWDVRHRLSRIEYVLCLLTFVFIQTFNVEYGIIAGILLYIFIEHGLKWDISSQHLKKEGDMNHHTTTGSPEIDNDLLLYVSDLETR